jgi:hypothetical protein
VRSRSQGAGDLAQRERPRALSGVWVQSVGLSRRFHLGVGAAVSCTPKSRRASIFQEVPEAEPYEVNVRDEPPILIAPVYEVVSWRPGDVAAGGPTTEVHLLLPVVDGVRVALRLKSARALDELVAVLLEYRREVFK